MASSSRRWARKLERSCCAAAKYFPLLFVYGLTTWATSAVCGVFLYLLLNWSYTTAVFTPPGSTTNDNGYSTLPTHAAPAATSFTVKSNGELRFCKKCQARKPDRAHHCSTCRRCVLKMDHHCPWLATCVGLRNQKAFLLFLIYTTLFCIYCFATSGAWVWEEVFNTTSTHLESMLPVNYIMLCVIAGIIGIVIGAFCGWHIYLATPSRASPAPKKAELRREPSPSPRNEYETATSASGPQLQAGSRRFTYDEMERHRARRRYEEYLDEQDSGKLPNAFDLGPRRNLLHLFGPNPWLWPVPVCTTTGDGWSWEPNPRWVDARERVAREVGAAAEERAAGWGPGEEEDGEAGSVAPPSWNSGNNTQGGGAGRHYLHPQQQQRGGRYSPNPSTSSGRRTPSKADRILGRDPNMYADDLLPGHGEAVSMKRLSPAGRTIEDELDEIDQDDEDEYEDDDSDDQPLGVVKQQQQQHQQQRRDEAERRAMNVVTNGRWGGGRVVPAWLPLGRWEGQGEIV
ncbi:palmitoyltransferase for Vac8p [Collariella sp. IMI 366227]|nr:palmitoyltransferase for Vac8p [Collariella sp. IMI 366227]